MEQLSAENASLREQLSEALKPCDQILERIYELKKQAAEESYNDTKSMSSYHSILK